ncbi:hypothetical protein D3C76_1148250 [compost metagenome]
MCTISTEQAASIAASRFPPKASHAAITNKGRKRFPPAKREYLIDSFKLTGTSHAGGIISRKDDVMISATSSMYAGSGGRLLILIPTF